MREQLPRTSTTSFYKGRIKELFFIFKAKLGFQDILLFLLMTFAEES